MMSMSVNAMTQDEAKIKRTVNGFSVLADQGAFEYLGRLLTTNVVVDYTSLFGGDAEILTREQLMKRWAGFLPGFDTTFHELEDPQVVMSQNKATVNVAFTASHWLGEKGYWQIFGTYKFELSKEDNSWKISSIKTIGENEKGSREMLGEVAQFAEQNLKSAQAELVNYTK
ncbi:nuclear transport factor 2 family protein [Thalassotalea euphylliae]|uniref:nuclear transport factor 2 family protein n=1 Tax=Thalassotalea euphylliae TaxID=1655234 RepID=UPI0036323667